MEKKYDFRKTEPVLQQFWEAEGIYRYRGGREGAIYSIDTPPPTVSGSLHIGHVFSYTQAEMVARFKRMQGYDVFYPFGFDDNGLPTERLVEKEADVRAADLPRMEFRARCHGVIGKYESDFENLWKRMGFSVDWNLKYQTVSDLAQKISQKSFLDLVKMGKAYMKESPVLWCTECRTSIAQAELETRECETSFNYIPFETDMGELLIATTRPELLAGCVCVFVHPEDTRYGKYVGGYARVPLYDFEIPILADDTVSMEKGTGAVMCATFGDQTDVEWCRKHGLPYREVILQEGRIKEDILYVGGMKIRAARAKIIALLWERNLLRRQEIVSHMVAVHERCGTEVEILPSNQWYIDVLSEKERFLQAADEIRWHPESMKNRYKIWVENLKWDWCISRQRYFGVPFPVWYCKSCKQPIFATPEQLPVNPLNAKPLSACSCGCSDFLPETAVMDTWATSSLTPLINARYGEAEDRSEDILPMGMRHQAHEIIRTWAFYTIVKSLYHTGKIPWRDIMISGFVLAKPGEKISKSKNNGANSPMELIETHSADAVRYWAAGSKLGTDTFFGEEDLKQSRRFLNKLYNAAKFCIMQLKDPEAPEESNYYCLEDSEDLGESNHYHLEGPEDLEESNHYRMEAPENLLPIDRWILERVNQTTRMAAEYLNDFEIGQARHEIDELFWKDFCDYYIEIVKERLYQPEKHGFRERRSGQTAIYHALLGILKLYAIYTPYMTEYIYQDFYRKYEKTISLHQLLWEIRDTAQEYLDFGEHVKEVIAGVRKQKAEQKMSMKDTIPELRIACPERFMDYYRITEADMKACTGAEQVLYCM